MSVPMKSLHLILTSALLALSAMAAENEQHLLYVATPGIRNDLAWGGNGVLVFDMDHGHKFVKRIPFSVPDDKGAPRNVKGICANAETQRLYISTTHTLTCLDLITGKLLWEKAYEGGCDRMSMTAVPISILRVLAPTAARSGKGDASCWAK